MNKRKTTCRPPIDESVRAHYRALVQQNGDSHVSAQYSSRESQEARFSVLVDVGDLDGQRVLDFGCGCAHLSEYLAARSIRCSYTGVDIVEEFFPIARKKFPDHRFGTWDDFASERFDYAFVSGVFNNRIHDNKYFFESTVALLLQKVEKGIAFNLMSSYVDFEDPHLWYTNPECVFKYMKTLTPFVDLRHDYVVKSGSVPFEYTVYAYKNGLEAFR
jgi:SAM-dependent methyltransferase